jgi:hypothetical protein
MSRYTITDMSGFVWAVVRTADSAKQVVEILRGRGVFAFYGR